MQYKNKGFNWSHNTDNENETLRDDTTTTTRDQSKQKKHFLSIPSVAFFICVDCIFVDALNANNYILTNTVAELFHNVHGSVYNYEMWKELCLMKRILTLHW